MLYEVFQPPPRLAPYVRFFWVLEAEVEPGGQFVQRTLADGCVEIVFHYRTTFDEIAADGSAELSPFSNIQAQSTAHRRFAARGSFGIFGTYLYPFAIPRLFGRSAAEFTNASPDLRSAFGREADPLNDRIAEAANNAERVRVMGEYLTGKLDRSPRELPIVHRAVRDIIAAGGTEPVGSLAARYGISKRQFERLFKDVAGLAPKLYSRVARFQAAARQRAAGVRDLAEIAHACGYYDQSHFINDFREFSGFTPGEYFLNDAEGTQYMEA